MFVLVEMQIALALGLAAAEESIGRGELGHDEAASRAGGRINGRMQKAGIADEAAEDRVSHACHGRKNGGGRDAHAADLDTLRYRRGLSRAAGNRSVPVLAHGII